RPRPGGYRADSDRGAPEAIRLKLDSADARSLEDCMAGGGVAVLPTDTVYGLCCDPDSEEAARRLYGLKGRPARRASAVMFFALEPALEALGELPDSERGALQAL